ncbi:MAG TPA: hypothetical protein VIK04_16055 [Solirubrobacteraceae bacterium]
MRRDLRCWGLSRRRGLPFTIGVLVCALALPATAAGARPHSAPRSQPGRHQTSGTIVSVDWSGFTIQSGGRRMSVTGALTQAADVVTADDYSYVYGGGHAEAGTASVGIKGPGFNGRRAGYDCSGSVAAVLSEAGVWPAGSPVPNDAGIITQLLQAKLIAGGAGSGPDEVTLYDDPGVHIFMNIDGRFFGTSDGGGGNPLQRHGGAGWLDDGAPDASSHTFKRYHLKLSVLTGRTMYGPNLTLETGSDPNLITGFSVGDDVRVSYTTDRAGAIVLATVTYMHAKPAGGLVTAVSASGDSFTVSGADRRSQSFSITPNAATGVTVQVGDTVTLTYTAGTSGELTARTVTIVSSPTSTAGTPTSGTGTSGTGTSGGSGGTPGGGGGGGGAGPVTGTITMIAPDDSLFSLQLADGRTVTFSSGGNTGLVSAFQIGSDVQVTFTGTPGAGLTAQSVTAVP